MTGVFVYHRATERVVVIENLYVLKNQNIYIYNQKITIVINTF